MAAAFHIDPAAVWSGSDFDVAVRLAAERRLGAMIREQATGG